MNPSSTDSRVIVIGAGLAGLSAACTLAARGHKVALFERNRWLGGKAAVLKTRGYRFDMGPTILTIPNILRRVFSEAGRNLDDHMKLVRLDPQWRCFFDDKSVLDLHQDIDKMAGTLDAFAPGNQGGDRYRRFIHLSKRLHNISDRFFFWKSIDSIRDMFKVKNSFNASTLSDVLAMRMGSTVGATIRAFTPDNRVAQMLDHFTQYVGSAPDQSPAVLCGIAHMQTRDGVWYPIGGTRAVPEALEKLARELGVEIHEGLGVHRILIENGRAVGVVADDHREVRADAVVSNMDSLRTYRELIGGEIASAFEGRRRYEPACSGVVLYLGLNKAYDHLAHHCFVFSRDPHEEFETIYRRGEPAPDPTCYLAAPARTEPGVAPPGGEALYVLVHTPYLRPGHDWKKMLPGYRKVILDKLKRTAGLENIDSRIVVEDALTPQDINDRYHVLKGAIYGLASHGRFFGAFKPGNRRRDVKGLYLTGGAAHPGPGMPMVLMSGWIAADSVHQDLGGSPVADAEPFRAGSASVSTTSPAHA